MSFSNIFHNKVVIVSGHSGFKGSWLSIWLKQLGAHVIGISDNSIVGRSNFVASDVSSIVDDHRFDIRDTNKVRDLLKMLNLILYSIWQHRR